MNRLLNGNDRPYYREDAEVIESWAGECLASQEVLRGGYTYYPGALIMLRGLAMVVKKYLPTRPAGYDIDKAADMAKAEIALMAIKARYDLGLL
jgi:hypothetical protein